jgi:tRNA(adenine34) deaminase
LNVAIANDADTLWSTLDNAWQVAFAQAWAALRAGSIPVGACVTDSDGRVLHAARNRTGEHDGPPGEVWGSALAHAEINVLARAPFRSDEPLVLTTTLEPCLQCAAAIRLAQIAVVRFAGADPYWGGCHEFGRLSEREAARTQPERVGPRTDALGRFARLIPYLGPPPNDRYVNWMRDAGEGPTIALAARLRADGEIQRLAALEVQDAFAALWDQLVAPGDERRAR